MSKATDSRINLLLDNAERNQRCLAVTGNNLARQMKRRCERGQLENPLASLYVRTKQWNQLNSASKKLWQLRGLGTLHPEWTFACFSAAVAYDLAVSNSLLSQTHILSTERHKVRSNTGLVTYAISGTSPTIINGIRCTPIERTLFDCARIASLPNGLAIVDSALRSGLVKKDDLEAYFLSLRSGWRGAPKAREICSLATPLAESGGESIARGMMYQLGFQMPELQVSLADPVNPSRSYRVDFLWRLRDGRFIIGEFDGREKYTNPTMTNSRDLKDVLLDERRRESRISFAGARIVRFGYKDLLNPAKFEHLLETFGVPRQMNQ